jgi:acetylornithine/succinyldiaminopimelate/putrescine aminotransferase/predicted amino acid dehydrogenase
MPPENTVASLADTGEFLRSQARAAVSPVPSADLYREHCKPKLAELLRGLKLDQSYCRGVGCSLFTDEGKEVVDFIGGFGVAIAGHNHPALKAALVAALEADVPAQAQVSVRVEAARLAARLNALVPGDAAYLVCFTNSGTESVEAALKHAYKARFEKIAREYERISRVLNDFYYSALEAEQPLALPDGKKLVDFRDDVDEYNLAQFEKFQDHPVVIGFKGAFHGKSTSSLKVTFNKSYREGFQGLSAIDPVFIDPRGCARIPEIIAQHQCVFLYPMRVGDRVELCSARISAVIALIFEPILGEGGIVPLPEATLEYLAAHHGRLGLPYIIDEIQTGCGRTGSFFAYEQTPLARITPEYIVLSKALGGGLVKIGATLIRKDIYEHDFDILHTSTFGEDDVSAVVAGRFLDLLHDLDGAMLTDVRVKGARLAARLQALKTEFPTVIKDVRGRGLMLGVEFTDLAERSPFFRLSGKQGILSLLVASYLLEHHGVRLLAPLTTMLKGNPGKNRRSVLRIQPPVTISDQQVDALIVGLREVLQIIESNNEYCLLGHLVGARVSARERQQPRVYPNAWPTTDTSRRIDSRVGFIIHPTTLENLLAYFFPSFAHHQVDAVAVRSWWNRISRFLEPVHVKSDYVEANDFVVEANLVLVPYLPEYLTSKKPLHLAREVRDKIQDAVTVAKELGDDQIPLNVVGLGAFTSIATDNGLSINDYEMAITTGNAYTVGLTLQGLREAARVRGKDWSSVSVAVVGANGNIGQALARVLAPQVGRLLLVGSSREDSEARLQFTKALCVTTTLCDPAGQGESRLAGGAIRQELHRLMAQDGEGTDAGKSAGPPNRQGCGRLARALAPAFIDTTTGFDRLHEADIVVVATNSADAALIRPEMVRRDAIVSCSSVPSNLDPNFAAFQDILAFSGGLAQLPGRSEIRFVGMPERGMAYGCLAETLLLGFDGCNHSFAKGSLEPALVHQVLEWADIHGFKLGPFTLDGKTKLGRDAA